MSFSSTTAATIRWRAIWPAPWEPVQLRSTPASLWSRLELALSPVSRPSQATSLSTVPGATPLSPAPSSIYLSTSTDDLFAILISVRND